MEMDIKALIEQEKEVIKREQELAPITFNAPVEDKAGDKATELVEQAFNQAIVHRVVENQEVQKELLDSADTVIHNKLNAVKARADQEDKETHFNNKKGACECFGYNEATTEKWAVNAMNIWHNVMTALWLALGFFTFAPVTFIAKKIAVIFKKSWVAIVLAIVIYLIFTLVPILAGVLL